VEGGGRREGWRGWGGGGAEGALKKGNKQKYKVYAFKICKCTNMTGKKIRKFQVGYQKTQNFMLIPNILKWALNSVPKKVYSNKSLLVFAYHFSLNFFDAF
jgi:hypothetical protein